MTHSKSNIVTFLCIMAAIAAANTASACEFHGGLGGSPFGGFGQASSHSYAPARAKPTLPESKIQLKAPAMLKAVRNKEIELPINYLFDTEEASPSIQLALKLSPTMTMASSEDIVLNTAEGQHTFSILPKALGTFRVLVTARDLNDSSPERRHTIYLKVSDS